MLTHSESLTVCIIIPFHLYNYCYYRYYYYFRWLVQYPFKYVIWTLANVLRSVAKTPSVSTANISTVHTHNKIYNSVYNISHKGQLLVCVAVERTRYTLRAVLNIDHYTKIKRSHEIQTDWFLLRTPKYLSENGLFDYWPADIEMNTIYNRTISKSPYMFLNNYSYWIIKKKFYWSRPSKVK